MRRRRRCSASSRRWRGKRSQRYQQHVPSPRCVACASAIHCLIVCIAAPNSMHACFVVARLFAAASSVLLICSVHLQRARGTAGSCCGASGGRARRGRGAQRTARCNAHVLTAKCPGLWLLLGCGCGGADTAAASLTYLGMGADTAYAALHRVLGYHGGCVAPYDSRVLNV